ncbi:serine protease [Streptomyces uncialis]|uniref:Serine protease n=1 Tax=Streptomyces uncialis TaxID=1048205 RepID=A0A1Q4VA23_9ACTN|nr:serine protease [Streptomyces uncialis]
MSPTHIPRRGITVSLCTAVVAALALGALPATADTVTRTATATGTAVNGTFAQGVIQNAGAPGAIEGSYVVTLHPSAADAGSKAGRRLAAAYGATIDRTYGAALNGYAVRLPESRAKKFAADPAVASVAQNHLVKASATQFDPPSWGLDRIDQRTLPLDQRYTYPDSAGQGVTAYVIDTGVRTTHGDFGGRAAHGYDAIDNDSVAQDGNGHGTHVAGIVAGTRYGVAKKARVVGVRVLNDAGSGTIAQVIAGIDWVTANAVRPAVANLSLGGGANSALDTAVRNSIASGITYTVAAGGSAADASGFSPARVAEAITVGAATITDARAGSSNYGRAVDLFAPGVSITSLWNTGDQATATLSGTSMAAPHAAGVAALHLADSPGASPAQVAATLIATATPGGVGNPGPGSPNRLLYIGP